MGLFSRKSKQDRLTEDSGRFYSKDDDAAIGERARAKRASNAGGGATRRPGNDPMLPEKKRARRRLVGAIALALAAAVGLPMLLDSEPKPLAGDIAIQIPAKDKAAPLPVPAADKTVSAADSVDKDEEVVDAPPPASTAKAPAAVAAAKHEDVAAQP
jgi:DedD protein